MRAVCHCFGPTIPLMKRKLVRHLATSLFREYRGILKPRPWPSPAAGDLVSDIAHLTGSATKWVMGLPTHAKSAPANRPAQAANRYMPLQLRRSIGGPSRRSRPDYVGRLVGAGACPRHRSSQPDSRDATVRDDRGECVLVSGRAGARTVACAARSSGGTIYSLSGRTKGQGMRVVQSV
jgi:hypothetical protein